MYIQNSYNYSFFNLPYWMVANGNKIVGYPPPGTVGKWLVGVNYTFTAGSETDTFWLGMAGTKAKPAEKSIFYCRGVLQGE